MVIIEEIEMPEIVDGLDWIDRFGRWIPPFTESDRGRLDSYANRQITRAIYSCSPVDFMPEYLYETWQLDEYRFWLSHRIHEYYLTIFEMYYTKLEWWNMFERDIE